MDIYTVDKDECGHPRSSWIWASGEEDVVITLNSYDITCSLCGETGYFRDEDD